MQYKKTKLKLIRWQKIAKIKAKLNEINTKNVIQRNKI